MDPCSEKEWPLAGEPPQQTMAECRPERMPKKCQVLDLAE